MNTIFSLQYCKWSKNIFYYFSCYHHLGHYKIIIGCINPLVTFVRFNTKHPLSTNISSA